MKTNLTDITFLILVRLDSIERLENLLCITEQFCRYFDTNIIIREVDSHCNSILKTLLNKRAHYEFMEDKDPVLYKTRHFNQMIKQVKTVYLAIWDADIVVDKKTVIDCVDKLRKKEADVVYPYNGICFDVPNIIKNTFLRKKDYRFLVRHKKKMNWLYPNLLVGGAVLINKDKFIKAGMENEKHYGWGNDDFDRYYRFIRLGYIIYRADIPLFHLSHPRGSNSSYRDDLQKHISCSVLLSTANS